MTSEIRNKGIKILGTGSYTPPFTVRNDEFAKHIETSDEWIQSRTGIKERHINLGKTNHFMAAEAAKAALENAETKASEIDLIIVSTCTNDFYYPSVSCIVQHELENCAAACIDVNSACTGFITALDTARNFLAAVDYKKVLVIASENLTPQIDFTERTNCVLFGDGAGAAVVETSDNEYASFLGAYGEDINDSVLYCRINTNPNIPFTDENKDISKINENISYNNYLQMNGKPVYKFAVDVIPKAINKTLGKINLKTEDIDILIPHQANLRIIQAAMKTAGIPMEKVHNNIETHGNCSSACLPTCLDEVNRMGKLKEGSLLCLVGFGAGLTYGAILVRI